MESPTKNCCGPLTWRSIRPSAMGGIVWPWPELFDGVRRVFGDRDGRRCAGILNAVIRKLNIDQRSPNDSRLHFRMNTGGHRHAPEQVIDAGEGDLLQPDRRQLLQLAAFHQRQARLRVEPHRAVEESRVVAQRLHFVDQYIASTQLAASLGSELVV